MKRQIVCKPCRTEQLGAKQYPGEWSKDVSGVALRDYQCDLCGDDIKRGERCNAESYGLDRDIYYEWEDEYLELGA